MGSFVLLGGLGFAMLLAMTVAWAREGFP